MTPFWLWRREGRETRKEVWRTFLVRKEKEHKDKVPLLLQMSATKEPRTVAATVTTRDARCPFPKAENGSADVEMLWTLRT